MKKVFESGTELELAFIEFKCLIQSYLDISGEDLSPLLFTLEKGLERFEQALVAHQSLLKAELDSCSSTS